MKRKIELDNLQWLFDNYGMSIGYGSAVIGVDYLDVESDGIDLVVYNIEGLEFENEPIYSYEQLVEYCNDSGLDEENFEVNRVTLVRR